MIATVTQIGPQLGIAPTCAALGLPRATYYRRRRPRTVPPRRRPSPRALTADERTTVLARLHEPRSEAHFKTLKYRPTFPDRFGSLQDARVHGQSFFTWTTPNIITAAWPS